MRCGNERKLDWGQKAIPSICKLIQRAAWLLYIPSHFFHSCRTLAKRRRDCTIACPILFKTTTSYGIRGKIRLLEPRPSTPSQDTAPEEFPGSTFSSKLGRMRKDKGVTSQVPLKMLVEQESSRGTAAVSKIYITYFTPCKIQTKSSPNKLSLL